MKIGMVLYPTFGGSGIVATELGKSLVEKGHEVHFITYREPVRLGDIKKGIFYHEVMVSDYPLFDYSPYELVLTSKLIEVVEYHNLDVLHVHYAIPHASAAFMAQRILREKGIEIPYVTTLHGTDITLVGRDKSFEPVITFAINKSNAVTAVSNSLKQDTYKYFEVDKDIRVIYNFVDLIKADGLKGSDLKKQYAPNGEIILSHISNFRKVKRIGDIIRIFSKLNETVPAKLLLVGDGPERYELQQLCKELGTCDRVTFLGKLENPMHILAISDMYLLTSLHESFGLSALEAMACGVPVISSNVGGISEVNKHGFSGYLSEVGDVEDMTKNALKILSSPETLDTFKKNARIHAEQFEKKKIVAEYEALYVEMVEEVKATERN
ncbi:MAG: N-acetyl-alpha-D-glucosaminyl L-malate synthase BshA [Flavobacteriales bacterium]|jgi:N-acetyl-alpha-D-glucosaminyl L-malate synthase BshA